MCFSESVDLNLNENHLDKILNWSVNKSRITNVNELVNNDYKFIWMQPSKSALKTMDYDKGNNISFNKTKTIIIYLKIHN